MTFKCELCNKIFEGNPNFNLIFEEELCLNCDERRNKDNENLEKTLRGEK